MREIFRGVTWNTTLLRHSQTSKPLTKLKQTARIKYSNKQTLLKQDMVQKTMLSPAESHLLSPSNPSPSPGNGIGRVGGTVQPMLSPLGVSNSVMGGQTYHGQETPPLGHAASSSVRTVTPHYTDSPASFAVLKPNKHQNTPSGRNSLVGFDPLLAGDSISKTYPNSPPLSKSIVNVEAPSKRVAAHYQATPEPYKMEVRVGGGIVETPILSKEMLAIRQQTSNEENTPLPEQRTVSREGSPIPKQEGLRTPPTPVKVATNATSKTIEQVLAKSNTTPSAYSPGVDQPLSVHPLGLDKSSGTPQADAIMSPRTRKMQWPKVKSHRRTQSLETKSVTGKEVKKSQPVSASGKADLSNERNSSFVQDLMELSFDKLMIPSLAKPSPTSFLTGHEDEVMRTCEYEAAPFQLEIPSLAELTVTARLNEFVENYRRMDQNFDLQEWQGLSTMQLRQVSRPQHVPIAQLLLECGDDVCVRGVVQVGTSADDRLEVAVFEGQRHFIAVIRGTSEQQARPGSNKLKKKAVPLGPEKDKLAVYQCFVEEYKKIEAKCFALLDKVTEEQPFCDVVFTGFSFGAGLATLAAVRYSNARPMVRVQCYPMASPKVGFAEFRQMVNSSPNLRLVRLEYGQDAKCQLLSPSGSHVGHTLVLNGSLGSNANAKAKNAPVLAYKFESPKHKKFKTIHPDLRSYVAALEEITRLKLPWAKDFVGTGKGVVVNNEAREMV